MIFNENRPKFMLLVDSGRSKNIPKCQVPEEHNGGLWLINFEGFSPIQSIRLIKSHKRTARLWFLQSFYTFTAQRDHSKLSIVGCKLLENTSWIKFKYLTIKRKSGVHAFLRFLPFNRLLKRNTVFQIPHEIKEDRDKHWGPFHDLWNGERINS